MVRTFIVFFLSYFLLVSLSMQAQKPVQQELNTGWKFRQCQVGEWMAAEVPGTVHTDLMHHQKIQDPFYRTHEKEVQWVDKVNWEYTLTFRPETEIAKSRHQQFIFYGLDTWCDVFLNGEKMASPCNMFRTWKIDVSGKLKQGDNVLRVLFYSPITRGLEEMERYGLSLPASNDYSEYGGMGPVKVSVFTRKAPYHFGWDWGPRLVTSGIWRPVVLEGWNDLHLENSFIRQPSVTPQTAQLEAEVNFFSEQASPIEAEIVCNGRVLTQTKTEAKAGQNRLLLPFSIKNPKLWWSKGLGEPHLYAFTIRLKKEGETKAEQTVRTGLRSLKLIREKDEKGETFYFELNGQPVFAKGTNMIPNDIFLPRIGREGYEKVVQDAANANMNMIRIWGGGIYEDDYFYELCDQHGIMVWQDFMFACAMYPGNKEFLDNVRQEAIDNIIRLRNHPCIALWCGNNEIDAAWARWGWQKTYTEAEKQQIFQAYTQLFHQLLPEIVTAYTDGDDYWPSSPMSGPGINAHEILPSTSGDNHYWGVWHSKHRFEEYRNNIGRFISEYGFQSFPEFNTVKKYTLPEDYDIESEVMSAHQRSGIGNLRIKEYLGWYYRETDDFEQFLYLSQVLQAKAMRTALQAHRRAMPYCMGSLVWQLNDCWPVASWSTTDYYHNWKAAHYAIREACKPVILVPDTNQTTLELWIVNDLLKNLNGNYSVEVMDFNGQLINRINGKFKARANSSASIARINKKELLKGRAENEVVAVISVYNRHQVWDEQQVYFAVPRQLLLPENPQISVTPFMEKGEHYIKVTARQLACDVMFSSPDASVTFEDNYLDILPNRTYVIKVKTGQPHYQVTTRSMNQ